MDSLEKLGFNEYQKTTGITGDYGGLAPARVMAEHRGLYIVSTGGLEFSAKVTGSMVFSAESREDYPAVGDWVLISMSDEKHAVINSILQRRTILKRKTAGKESDMQIIATNIDTAFVMQSLDRDYNLNRIERYMALARSGDIETEIILNKTDIIEESRLILIRGEMKERFPGTIIYETSFASGKGIDALRAGIKKAHTYCFIGSSGVGKSSIINLLLKKEAMKTGEISIAVERGKHVTTHRQLLVLENGGLLIDTPGMREIGLLDSEIGIGDVFSEINKLSHKCRFDDCTHIHEPGCAVLEALRAGEIDEEKYVNYKKLLKENKHNTMSNIERKQSDRQFGKFLKNYNKHYKKK